MRKMKNVVVVYHGDDWKKKVPLVDALPTRESFEFWHEEGLKRGIAMYRGSINWYNPKKNVFKKAWAYRNNEWIKITKPIRPDLIFDKIKGVRDYSMFDFKMDISKKVKIFNNPLFRTMFDNKLSQYLVLSEFMPDSYLAIDKKHLVSVLKKIRTAKVVMKPPYGSGGFGIKICKKKEALKKKMEYPIFVQEFVRSEKGIPGFSKKNEVADLRMVFVHHKLIYALSRIARKGSLFTNFHQGATAILVPKKFIPRSARKIARKVIKKLSIFPEANYCLDFIFTNSGKPLLVEINTTPGFDLLHIVGTRELKIKNLKEVMSVI